MASILQQDAHFTPSKNKAHARQWRSCDSNPEGPVPDTIALATAGRHRIEYDFTEQLQVVGQPVSQLVSQPTDIDLLVNHARL